MNEACPCGSGRAYTTCCEPIIRGTVQAATAEALMRARYSAYVNEEIDFIVSSCVSDEGIDPEATRKWSRESKWKGLRIVRTEKGGPKDSEGIVEFVADYELDGYKETHRETARFKKQENRWLYDTGDVKTATVIRATPKVGRNDPCPCGSGKKYKQCCGRA